MNLYAPKYYKKFVCSADKCKHSCCIGWEIDVDDVTLKKYQTSKHGYGKKIVDSIDFAETPHFRLCEGERCPHLNESGLCNIILSIGEDHLCDICREHPRFYHDTIRGKEVGLGMACEEACRLILASDDYAQFDAIEELDIEEENFDFNALLLREQLYLILSDPSLSYEKKRSLIAEQHGVSTRMTSGEISLRRLNILTNHIRICFQNIPRTLFLQANWKSRLCAHWHILFSDIALMQRTKCNSVLLLDFVCFANACLHQSPLPKRILWNLHELFRRKLSIRKRILRGSKTSSHFE